MSDIEFNLQDYVRDFVGQVVRLPMGGGYARWRDRVCISVSNLEKDAAQYIVDRISQLAGDVGLEPGEPGCSPNVFIIFTVDAKTAASYMVENEPKLFRPFGGVCCMQLGLEALNDFSESDSPVRWWHVSMPVDVQSGRRAIRLPQDSETPINSVSGPSRIHGGIRDDLSRAIVIVDSTKLTGTTWRQLADYLAFISLAQVDPHTSPTEFHSILNLFANPDAYSGLTDWDMSYLQALYSFDQARTRDHQLNALVSEMTREDLGSEE